MIDNFDHLVERCTAKKRKQMLRMLTFVGIAFFLMGALVFGYFKTFSSSVEQTKLPVHEEKNADAPAPVEKPYHVRTNSDVTESAEKPYHVKMNSDGVAPIKKPLHVEKEPLQNPVKSPMSLESKTPICVLQLLSTLNLTQAKTFITKFPKKYQDGLRIYRLGKYYILCYIDIYQSSSIAPLKAAFKKLGFNSTLLNYNPDRVVITSLEQVPHESGIATAPQSTVNSAPTQNRSLFQVTSSSQEDLKEVSTYQAAIVKARDFYEKNSFAEAATWAKKANQLNREQEEAWLLYAKSYWAQGRKTEALRVLELYMNYKDSKAATQLYRTYKASIPN